MFELDTRPGHPYLIRQEVRRVSRFLMMSENKNGAPVDVSRGLWGAITGQLNHALRSDVVRRILLWWLLGDEDNPVELHSSSLTNYQKMSVVHWVGLHKLDDNSWVPNPHFLREVQWVANSAIAAFRGPNSLSDLEKLAVKNAAGVYTFENSDESMVRKALLMGGVVKGEITLDTATAYAVDSTPSVLPVSVKDEDYDKKDIPEQIAGFVDETPRKPKRDISFMI